MRKTVVSTSNLSDNKDIVHAMSFGYQSGYYKRYHLPPDSMAGERIHRTRDIYQPLKRQQVTNHLDAASILKL